MHCVLFLLLLKLVSSNLFFNKKSAKLESNRIEICKTSISMEVRQGEGP